MPSAEHIFTNIGIRESAAHESRRERVYNNIRRSRKTALAKQHLTTRRRCIWGSAGKHLVAPLQMGLCGVVGGVFLYMDWSIRNPIIDPLLAPSWFLAGP
jgi:hypothetical protein